MTSRDVSLDLHPPVPLPPGYLSWKRVLSRFIDLLLLRRFRNVSVRIRRGTVVQQLDSHPPNLSTNITTDITTVHSPHDIHPRHTIYRPALLNGREKRGGRGGWRRRAATAFNQVLNKDRRSSAEFRKTPRC